MTAVNIIRYKNSVCMLTDGAHLDDDGTLAQVGPKAFFLPHINAVCAARGAKMLGMFLADHIGHKEATYGEMKAGAVALTKKVYEEVKPKWEEVFGKGIAEFDLFVAGISESTGPDSFMVSSHNDHSEFGVEAFTLVDLGSRSFAPTTDALYRRSVCLEAWMNEVDAASLMSEQRVLKSKYRKASSPVSTVGAFAQLTTVSKGRIETRVIHRWDDKHGAQINEGF